jgi:hypothetical protein
MSGSGRAFATLDERYTQIRGEATLAAVAGVPGPAREVLQGGGGELIGWAQISAGYRVQRRPEDLGVDISLGTPTLGTDRIGDVEDYLLRAYTGNQLTATVNG